VRDRVSGKLETTVERGVNIPSLKLAYPQGESVSGRACSA
jgi:hypothetical protein